MIQNSLNKLGIESSYLVYNDLPSGMRSYKNIDKVLVRGLMFDEVKSLARYLSNQYDLKQLANCYQDVIRLNTKDGKIVPLENLEIVDFHYLIVVSSMFTDPDAEIKLTYKCKNCGEEHTEIIQLSDIKYNVDNLDISEVPLSDQELKAHPQLVKDAIVLSDVDDLYTKYLKLYNKFHISKEDFIELISYAVILNWEVSEDLFIIVNKLNSNLKLLNEVRNIDRELSTSLEPFHFKCNKCSIVNDLQYDFNNLRGYL